MVVIRCYFMQMRPNDATMPILQQIRMPRAREGKAEKSTKGGFSVFRPLGWHAARASQKLRPVGHLRVDVMARQHQEDLLQVRVSCTTNMVVHRWYTTQHPQPWCFGV